MESNFRKYLPDTPVANQYKAMRTNQTMEFAQRLKTENLDRLKNHGMKINVLDAIDRLDTMIDRSDPDISLSNIHHLYQTAEALRRDGHADWLQLVGLIHDLGKIMFLFGNDEEGTSIRSQWAVVGDTYLLGCRLRNHVYPEFDALCPDTDSRYSTDLGIYEKGCGFDRCTITWGHDEYLYDTLLYNLEQGNVCRLPEPAYQIIRYHSFYPWHSDNEYGDLESDNDRLNLPWIRLFNRYDLYTKENQTMDVNELKKYYRDIVYKYFPNGYLIF